MVDEYKIKEKNDKKIINDFEKRLKKFYSKIDTQIKNIVFKELSNEIEKVIYKEKFLNFKFLRNDGYYFKEKVNHIKETIMYDFNIDKYDIILQLAFKNLLNFVFNSIEKNKHYDFFFKINKYTVGHKNFHLFIFFILSFLVDDNRLFNKDKDFEILRITKYIVDNVGSDSLLIDKNENIIFEFNN